MFSRKRSRTHVRTKLRRHYTKILLAHPEASTHVLKPVMSLSAYADCPVKWGQFTTEYVASIAPVYVFIPSFSGRHEVAYSFSLAKDIKPAVAALAPYISDVLIDGSYNKNVAATCLFALEAARETDPLLHLYCEANAKASNFMTDPQKDQLRGILDISVAKQRIYSNTFQALESPTVNVAGSGSKEPSPSIADVYGLMDHYSQTREVDDLRKRLESTASVTKELRSMWDASQTALKIYEQNIHRSNRLLNAGLDHRTRDPSTSR